MSDKPIINNLPAPGNPPKPKIGNGTVAGMAPLGLNELRGAFYTGSNIAQPTEYGIYGHQTPGEIADDRKLDPTQNDPNRSLDEEPTQTPSPLQQSMREAESRSQDRSPEKSRPKGLDRE